MNQTANHGNGSMDGAALVYFWIGVLATVIAMALPLAYPVPSHVYRLILWACVVVTAVMGVYLVMTKFNPQKSLPVSAMALGFGIFCGGVLWYRSTPASATTEPPASAQSMPDQSQPAPDNPSPVAPLPPARAKAPPSTGPSFQQDNRGSTGTNLQGQFNAPITVNPPYDPSVPVVTYDFNGAKRITAPGRSELNVGEETTSFQNMIKMADAGEWQALLAESQKGVTGSEGKWAGARAFNGIALVRLGQKEQGYATLSEVKNRLETIRSGSLGYFNSLVEKYVKQL